MEHALYRGSTGSVQLAIDRTTGTEVAIKYIPRDTMDAKTVLREVLTPSAASHYCRVMRTRLDKWHAWTKP